MTTRTKHLTLAAAATVLVGSLLLGGGDSGTRDSIANAPLTAPTLPAPDHVDGVELGSDEALQEPRADLVGYAVAVDELLGFPPDAGPGTTLDLWVAWEPPITKRPRISPLIDHVIVEAVLPPLLVNGPMVAKLLVPEAKISDLFYGDRYGALSVVDRSAAD